MSDEPPPGIAAAILAAGKGTRFGSPRPKVLQPLAGRPVLGHIAGALRQAGISRLVAVVGYGAEQVRAAFPDLEFAVQEQQLGTGHALLQAHAALGEAETVLCINGDMPLIEPGILQALIDIKQCNHAKMAALTCDSGDVTGMGRVVRDSSGRPLRVVEEKAASAEEQQLTEWNCGVYIFDGDWLWPQLAGLRPSAIGEIYITDLFARAAAEGCLAIETIHDGLPVSGVNDRLELERVERVLRHRIRERLLRGGVLLVSPETSVIDVDVTAGWDTTILPGSVLTGATQIGKNCVIGPNAILEDCTVGDNCRVEAAHLIRVKVGDGEQVESFTRRRGSGEP